MRNLLQDFRYGWRGLRKSPGFAAVVVLVLALGIGANTAIFSVVNAVLLRPLPFEQPERLVALYHTPPQASFPGIPLFSVSAANFLDWRAQARSFEGMAAYSHRRYTMTGSGQPFTVPAIASTYGLFSLLHAEPLMGRTFVESEDQPGHDHEVVVSYAFWRDHLGASPAAVGKTIELNGEAYTVIGVMPAGFEFPFVSDSNYRPQMWKPQGWTAQQRAIRDNHNLGVVARLQSGVTLEQAKAELNTISDGLAQQYPKDDKGWSATAISLRQDIVGDARSPLLILLGAVAFVLLIACANIANLVLAKTLSRRKEVAIRTALGASRGRLLQQVLAETVLLSLMGGALGLIVAHYGVMFVIRFAGQQLPRSANIGLDAWVLAFTLGLSILTGLAAGLLPALRLTHEDVNEALKQSAGRTASDAGSHRTGNALVVVEVAFSLMLLIGAGLLIRSLWMLRSVNPGFDADHVITMDLSLLPNKFTNLLQLSAFYQNVLERVRALPSVKAAGLINSLPLAGGGSQQPIQVEGQPIVPMADQPEVDVRITSPGYLGAMRIPLVSGRDLDDSDVDGRPGAVLISQTMARQFWPNGNPVGKRLTLYFFPDHLRTVVGVVGDVKGDGLNQTRSASMLYMPAAQVSNPRGDAWHTFGMTLVARTQSDPASMISTIGSAIHQVDPGVALLNVKTMQDTVDDSLLQQRFTMFLLVGFAALAVLLAGVGIYSVLAYTVRRRLREIGIRMALGAQISDVLRMVVVEGMKPTLLGVMIGLAGALALGRVMASVIYGVSARDITTFASVAAVMFCVGLLASTLPAYRATRVDPMKTLRDE
jgi:putative ABC transport system permease protein